MIHKTQYQWIQCSAKNPCPACKSTHDCTVSTNGLYSKCMKVEGGTPIKQTDGRVAYLRRVSECPNGVPGRTHKPKPAAAKLTAKEIELQIKQCRSALSQRRIDLAVKEIGVSERALNLLEAGWHDDYSCLSFPMYNGNRKPVGIRLRRPYPKPGQNRYLSVIGSGTGLFIPTNYDPSPCAVTLDPAPMVLLMPEGPTDVSAALDLGFMAVGRPSNAAGERDIRELLTAAPAPIEIILFADYDGAKFLDDGTPYSPGWEGALHVAREISGHPKLSRLRVVMPPKGTKDLRQWMREGGTAEMVKAILTAADTATPLWIGHKLKALKFVKQETKRLIDSRQATDRDDALRKAKARMVRTPAMV